MWVKSWNKIHGLASEDEHKLQLYFASDETGYFLGTSENPDTNSSYSVYEQGTTGYIDTLYYPHPLDSNGNPDKFTESSNCNGYWLASPSADRARNVMYVDYSGAVTNFVFSTPFYGVRPVVCLPSDITARWNDTVGVWEITKK